MLDLKPTITRIFTLLREDSDSSVTYAALECRLAIERICYERLRLAHDYISTDDIKRWQPRDVIKFLSEEVNSEVDETLTISVSKSPIPHEATEKDVEHVEFIDLGTQIGFNPQLLGRIWNALSQLALHAKIPASSSDFVSQYGNKSEIKIKVLDALDQITKISEGTITLTGLGLSFNGVISFICKCGANNKRRQDLLFDGQVIGCQNPQCLESYLFVKQDCSFGRRTLDVYCRKCSKGHHLPLRKLERLKTDQHINFSCEGCGEEIIISWRPMQSQK